MIAEVPSDVKRGTWAEVGRALMAMALSASAGAALAPSSAFAQGEPSAVSAAAAKHAPAAASSSDAVDYWRRRYEPAGFPLIGGNSDIGVEFGGAATVSYFANGVRPYAWNMDLLASASLKGGPSGVELAQHSYLWQLDWPGLFGGGVRLGPEVAFSRTINQGYFGLGNASSGAPAPSSMPNPDRYHEFIENVLLLRSSVRVELSGPYAALFNVEYRYVVPEAYAGSLLASDERSRSAGGAPLIYATSPMSLGAVAGGIAYDSRDNEIFTNRGMFHQVGFQLVQGVPLAGGVRYGEAGAILSGFVPLFGPVVFAGRFVADFQIGNVPFFDLFTAGPFQRKELIGGSSGVRGVPIGRYLGPIKIAGNAELRAKIIRLSVFKQRFTFGGDIFFDTGRIWSDYSFRSSLDGSGVGLKFGAGCGVYWMWGQAAIFRVEAAYSPDAVSENPALPIGLYVEDGTMF